MSDVAYITNAAATLTFTAGSKTVTVTGTNPILEGVLRGDRAPDPNGMELAIDVVAAGTLTLLRNAPTSGTVPFDIAPVSRLRTSLAANAEVTREVYAKLLAAVEDNRSIPVISLATAPPGSPADGDRHLVIATATGAFTGKEGYIAQYDAANTRWIFIAPIAGMKVTVDASLTQLQYSGSEWGEPSIANQNEATALFRLPNEGSGPPIAATMQQVRSAIGAFDTRAALASSYMASVLNYARTAGYSTAGDGGGALYKRKASEPSHPGKVQSGDGAWWELAEEFPNPLQFGAPANGTDSDRQAIVNCISYAGATGDGTGKKITFPARTFAWEETITIPNNNSGVSQIVLEGSGRYTTFLKALSGFTGTAMFSIEGVTDISHFGFDGNSQSVNIIENNQTVLGDIPTKIHHNNFISASGAALVNNTNGLFYFYNNRVGSCTNGVVNLDWGTGSRITDNDMLSTGVCVVLDNDGQSNEGMFILNNFIGSTGDHGMQLNAGLDIYILHNSFTPIQSSGSGKRGIVVTGGVGPVHIKNNWIEGLLCEVACSNLFIEGNIVPDGHSIVLNGPSSGSISNCRISNNRLDEDTVATVALTNCANMQVLFNNSAGPFFEAGGSLEMLIADNLLAGTSSFSSACVLRDNKGGTGYTNDIVTTSTGTTVNGTLTVSGAFSGAAGAFTGIVNFGDGGGAADVNLIKNVNGQRWIGLRNTNDGSSASIGFLFGDDVTAARGAMVAHSSARTDLAGPNSLNFGTYGNDPLGFFTGNTLRLLFRGSDGLIDYKFAAVTAGAPFTNTAKVPIYINGVAYNLMLCA